MFLLWLVSGRAHTGRKKRRIAIGLSTEPAESPAKCHLLNEVGDATKPSHLGDSVASASDLELDRRVIESSRSKAEKSRDGGGQVSKGNDSSGRERRIVPCVSWCLEGSLKPFHHDLRSRLLGGEAGLAPGIGWRCGGLAGFGVGVADAMML